MKFQSTCENCILAELSTEDLELLKLTYDELDYSNERVRDTLRYILDEASAETGIMLNHENEIRIDVMPDLIGGCLIIFSKNSSREAPDNENSLIFETDNFDDILDCAKILKTMSCSVSESAVFQNENTFRIAVKGCDAKALHILSEYLTECESEPFIEKRTQEYWGIIIEKDALKILCGN